MVRTDDTMLSSSLDENDVPAKAVRWSTTIANSSQMSALSCSSLFRDDDNTTSHRGSSSQLNSESSGTGNRWEGMGEMSQSSMLSAYAGSEQAPANGRRVPMKNGSKSFADAPSRTRRGRRRSITSEIPEGEEVTNADLDHSPRSRRLSTSMLGWNETMPRSPRRKSTSMLENLHFKMEQEKREGRPDLYRSRSLTSVTTGMSMFSTFELIEIESTGWVRQTRLWCGKVVEAPISQLAIVLLILLNGLLLGVATFDFVTDDPDVQQGFTVVDRIFLYIFTLEMLLQLAYRGKSYFQDGWMIFDFIVVVSSWSLESLQIMRALRVFRAMRLVTRVGPMKDLVTAIGAVMPRIYAIGLLLLLIFYIFAVLFTQLFSDLELSENYFGSLDVSLFTCMQLMTMEWAELSREVMAYKPWAAIPLVSFISITGFIIFNLVIAVVCDAVSLVDEQARAEKEAEEKMRAGESQEAPSKSAKQRISELTDQVVQMRSQNMQLKDAVTVLSQEWQHQFRKMQELQEFYRAHFERQGIPIDDIPGKASLSPRLDEKAGASIISDSKLKNEECNSDVDGTENIAKKVNAYTARFSKYRDPSPPVDNGVEVALRPSSQDDAFGDSVSQVSSASSEFAPLSVFTGSKIKRLSSRYDMWGNEVP